MEKKNVVDVKNLKKTYSKKGSNVVEALKSLNLEFLGFINPFIKKKFSKFFTNDKNNLSLDNWDKFERDKLEPIVNDLIKSNNTNFKGVGQPLRIILTGSKFGPGIYDIIISLGKEEVTKRLTNKKLT